MKNCRSYGKEIHPRAKQMSHGGRFREQSVWLIKKIKWFDCSHKYFNRGKMPIAKGLQSGRKRPVKDLCLEAEAR